MASLSPQLPCSDDQQDTVIDAQYLTASSSDEAEILSITEVEAQQTLLECFARGTPVAPHEFLLRALRDPLQPPDAKGLKVIRPSIFLGGLLFLVVIGYLAFLALKG